MECIGGVVCGGVVSVVLCGMCSVVCDGVWGSVWGVVWGVAFVFIR